MTPPSATLPLPRLGIIHLMLWTFWTAVCLAVTRELEQQYVSVWRVRALADIVTGAVLTGAMVLVSARVRCGPPMLRHPGHWLLFLQAVLTAIHVPLFVLSKLQVVAGGERFSLVYGVVLLFPAVAFVVAAHGRDAIRWKITFIMLSVFSVLLSLYYLRTWLMIHGYSPGIPSMAVFFGRLFLSVWMLVVSVLDLVHSRRRDWLHWAGVGTYVAYGCVMVVSAFEISAS